MPLIPITDGQHRIAFVRGVLSAAPPSYSEVMPYVDDPVDDDEARRQHRRRPRPRRPAEVEAEIRTLDLEEELVDLETPLARPRKQLRGDLWKRWGMTTTARNRYRMRDALFRYAPELETPRLVIIVDQIVEQKILLNQLMFAHQKLVPIHLAVAAKLQEFLEQMPPVRDLTDSDFLEAIHEMNKLLTKFQNTNPFVYVDKIENVVAKITALLEKSGLTSSSARRMGYDLEAELNRHLGLIAADANEDAVTLAETNRARRARLGRADSSPSDADEAAEEDEEIEADKASEEEDE